MRDISEAAVKTDGGYGVVGLYQLPHGMVQSVLDDRLHKSFTSDLSEVPAEGIGRHAGDGSGFFQGDRPPEVIHQVGEYGMDLLPVGRRQTRRHAAGIQQHDVFFMGQFLEDLQQTDEPAEVVLFGSEGMNALYGRGTEEPGAGVGEVYTAMATGQQSLDGADLGRREKALSQTIGGELDDDGGSGCVGRLQFPTVGEVRAQQYQVSGCEAGHMAADVTFTAAGRDQGQLVFRMEMEGRPKARLVKCLYEEGMPGHRVQDFK